MKRLLTEWGVILAIIAFVGLLFWAGLSLDHYTPAPPPQGTPITTCTLQEFWRYDPNTKMTQPYWMPVCETHYRMGGDK